MSSMGEKFRWVVYTRDGGSVSQVAASGTKNAYEDLPLDNLKSFELWDWQYNQRVLLVTFKPGERLVWRRRNAMNKSGEIAETCHIVGKIGPDYKGILGIFESDGHIETVADFIPNSMWFDPPSTEADEDDTKPVTSVMKNIH